MNKEIKMVKVDDNLLEACDISYATKSFFKEMSIENARLLGGKVVLTFPKYDKDKRPNCIIPEIRSFIQKLHNEEPRFPFYYVDEGVYGIHLQHVACLSPINEIVLLENGTKFRLNMNNPLIIHNYLANIDIFMQQLNYTELDISTRIEKIARSLGLQF